jgi:hypothetical protein
MFSIRQVPMELKRLVNCLALEVGAKQFKRMLTFKNDIIISCKFINLVTVWEASLEQFVRREPKAGIYLHKYGLERKVRFGK